MMKKLNTRDRMRIFFNVVLTISVFLAISSGITKITLMQQDVEFFGKYGFTNPILLVFGTTQLIGGVLLVLQKFRVIGAIFVAITFLISAILLVMDNNIPVTIITLVCVLLLGFIIRITLTKKTVVVTDMK